MFEFDIGGILFVAGIASGGQKFSTTDIFTASLNYRWMLIQIDLDIAENNIAGP